MYLIRMITKPSLGLLKLLLRGDETTRSCRETLLLHMSHGDVHLQGGSLRLSHLPCLEPSSISLSHFWSPISNPTNLCHAEVRKLYNLIICYLFLDVSTHMSGSVRTCMDMYPDVFGSVWLCPEVSRSVQKSPDVSVCVWMCPDVPRCVQICAEVLCQVRSSIETAMLVYVCSCNIFTLYSRLPTGGTPYVTKFTRV